MAITANIPPLVVAERQIGPAAGSCPQRFASGKSVEGSKVRKERLPLCRSQGKNVYRKMEGMTCVRM